MTWIKSLKKNMPYFIYTTIILIIIFGVTLFLIWGILLSNNSHQNIYNIDNIKPYEEDFKAVVDFVLYYQINEGKYAIRFFYVGIDNGEIYLSYNGKRIPISDELKKSIKFSREAFSSKLGGYDIIYVDEPNEVHFGCEARPYFLVYTANGKKPKYLDYNDNSIKFKVYKINKHWYNMIAVN